MVHSNAFAVVTCLTACFQSASGLEVAACPGFYCPAFRLAAEKSYRQMRDAAPVGKTILLPRFLLEESSRPHSG